MLAVKGCAHLALVAAGLSLDQLHFRYANTGDDSPWKPLRAFDDGRHVYIQFPVGIAQGELPPLFVVGPDGKGELLKKVPAPPWWQQAGHILRFANGTTLSGFGPPIQIIRCV